jgi:hypothetical protein
VYILARISPGAMTFFRKVETSPHASFFGGRWCGRGCGVLLLRPRGRRRLQSRRRRLRGLHSRRPTRPHIPTRWIGLWFGGRAMIPSRRVRHYLHRGCRFPLQRLPFCQQLLALPAVPSHLGSRRRRSEVVRVKRICRAHGPRKFEVCA